MVRRARLLNLKPAVGASRASVAPCVIAAFFLLQSCEMSGGFFGITVPGRQVWVAAEPIQCLGNPWEQDWLARHGNNYAAYPRDPVMQNQILRDYYARLGIDVSQVRSVPKYAATCDACACPRGDTLYLLVDGDDADEMIGLGYRKEAPGVFGP